MQYEAQTQMPAMESVGVWPRFLAVLIDSLIIGVVAGIMNALVGQNQAVVSGSLSGVLALAYFIILEATQGQRWGKWC